MKILVTGGCGFIGSHVVEALLAAGHQVTVLDNLSTGKTENLADISAAIELVRGDIREADVVTKAMQGVEVVVHLAALVSVAQSLEQPDLCHDINVNGCFHILDMARKAGVRRVVFASSAAVYGDEPELPCREDMVPLPKSPYGTSKLIGELYLRQFAEVYEIECLALRFFNVYGPRQDPTSPYSGVISKFADALRRGVQPVVYGDGSQTRDFVHVRDVAAALCCAVSAIKNSIQRPNTELTDTPCGVYNIASGRSVTLLDLLREMGQAVRSVAQPDFRPARIGDIRHSSANVCRAKQHLGWQPSVDLLMGLDDLLNNNYV